MLHEYNQQYIAEVVRAFSVYVQQVQNPGEGRNTFSVFTNLQTDDSGLETGAIFNHGGYVKIAQINIHMFVDQQVQVPLVP